MAVDHSLYSVIANLERVRMIMRLLEHVHYPTAASYEELRRIEKALVLMLEERERHATEKSARG